MTEPALDVPGAALPSDPHDREEMLTDVLEGLSLPQKELSPKYFYDSRGSELFEDITRLDEYYPTRTERALLERWMPVWVSDIQPKCLIELGAGSATKSRVVLTAMMRAGSATLYVPVDVSGDFLHETAARLRAEYHGLTVEPAVADMSAPITLPIVPPTPSWYALLGSTLGNFDTEHAVALLGRVADRLRPGDGFLLGVDLRPGPHKSKERLEAAYDDASGVTRDFNLNVLHVLNRELGSDFDPGSYRHRAFYDEGEGRIEMHLVAQSPQVVTFPEGVVVRLTAGESIRTEISCKYDRPTLDSLFAAAGLRVDRWTQDDEGLFALVLAVKAP